MKNSEVYEVRRDNRISHMAKAMQGWSESLGNVSTALPGGKFGRVVIVESGKATLDGSELDIEFEIPFDDEPESEEAEIVVYNLTKETIAELKRNAVITVTAGYKGDTGIIFAGRIVKTTTSWSGLDKVTTIRAIDSYNLYERTVESIAFAAGTKASKILRALVDRLGLPVAVFKVRRDYSYSGGVTVDGGLMAAIKQYAGVCGVSVYINKGKVYVRHISSGDDIGFFVNPDTGLLDSPEEFTEEQTNEDYTDTVNGVKLKMLLEHRMTTAAFVDLESKNYEGRYRVREGKHVCTSSDFYTEITCVDVGARAASSNTDGKSKKKQQTNIKRSGIGGSAKNTVSSLM